MQWITQRPSVAHGCCDAPSTRLKRRIAVLSFVTACFVFLFCTTSSFTPSIPGPPPSVDDEAHPSAIVVTTPNTAQLHPVVGSFIPATQNLHKSSTCTQSLHAMLVHWMKCIDSSTPHTAHSLRWLPSTKHKECNFLKRNFESFSDPLIVSLMATHLVESHGDSTLRELVKLLIGGLRMTGSLDKSDASSTMRYPKYFTRLVSNCSIRKGVDLRSEPLGSIAEWIAASPQSQLHHDHCEEMMPPASSSSLPLLFRIMFRFDFVPISFSEPLEGTVPAINEVKVNGAPSIAFFDAIVKRRVLLLSTGSHTAKLLAMNQSTHNVAKEMSKPGIASANLIFEHIVQHVEDYLILRVLRLGVERAIDGSVRLQPAVVKDEAMQPVDVVVMFEQTLECASMAEAKLEGFRQMSNYCVLINDIVHRINDELRRHFARGGSSTYVSGNRDDVSSLHPRSALRALSQEHLDVLAMKVWVVPLMECHGGRFQYSPAKPFCTRDGIHLRTKFIRQKLGLLLNLLIAIDECSEM